ncbi:enoyl-CoA hydratase-related protein [Aliidiomarina celeris]|uniref:enoyl-CoA hydratase-related protein n=1 Tax=Aliidiomarina celeris TaxID=2249428 RepID=UPI000DEBDABC|nr:enoyl-CoA hydratase-related protein [Aliidiomarina celeris]
MTDHVVVTEQQGIVRIHLNRPEKRNALTQAMYQQMTDALRSADERDTEVSAVLITGEGSLFCAGNDLGDFLRHGELKPDSPVFQFLQVISSVHVPVVAAVQGAAVGIGTTLLLHCDLVYATQDAQFVMPFVDMGLVPEAASSQLVPLLCGHTKASELLLLGEAIDAHDAERYNIVNKVVSSEQLEPTVMAVMEKLAAKPKRSLRLSKKLLKTPFQPIQERIQLELQDFLQVLASPETQAIIAGKAAGKGAAK